MTPLYNGISIRTMEACAFIHESSFSIMTCAGETVAQHAMAITGDNKRPVLVLAGPGNNGGDALIAATRLRAAGRNVRVAFLGNAKRLSTDAKKALALWGNTCDNFSDDNYALAIDGLFGIGLSRPLDGAHKEAVRRLNTLPCPTLSIDVPSGINSDTGAAIGEAVRATHTVTFLAAKPGLYTGCGNQAAGNVVVETLNFQNTETPCGFTLDDDDDLDWLRLQRQKNAHKGNCGTLAVVGGDTGMVGALALATRAAVRLGAGMVVALSPADNMPPLDWLAPEIMWRTATPEILETLPLQAVAIGVGLGTSLAAKALLETAIARHLPLVADADALNLLAQHQPLRTAWLTRKAPAILTPHPAEAARLLRCNTTTINQDRISAAKTLATNYNACIVLKGAGTVIADKNGWHICTAGNPGLAQAGAGDTLTGFIGALLAQTQDAIFAARAGVWLHAVAADIQATSTGKIGLDLNTLAATAVCRLNQCIKNKLSRRSAPSF